VRELIKLIKAAFEWWLPKFFDPKVAKEMRFIYIFLIEYFSLSLDTIIT